MKQLISAVAALLLFASAQSHAYFIDIDASELNDNELLDFSDVEVISLDASFFNSESLRFTVQREDQDLADSIGLSAVVNNFTGFGWLGFSVRVFDGATLDDAGDIFAFTSLETLQPSLSAGSAITQFNFDEVAGFELGDVFGDPSVSPWLIDVSTLAPSGNFSIEFAPITATVAVPVPATVWLLGCAFFGLGVMRRQGL